MRYYKPNNCILHSIAAVLVKATIESVRKPYYISDIICKISCCYFNVRGLLTKAHPKIETHVPIRVQLKLLYSDRLNRYSCSDLIKLFIDALGACRTSMAVDLLT